MSPELKSMWIAIAAGAAVVAAAFAVSAGVRHFPLAPPASVAVAREVPSAGNGSPMPGGATAIAAGRKLFATRCASCHGENGAGGFGPRLIGSSLPDASVEKTVANGVSGKMPAFKGKLSTENMSALLAYARSLKK